MARTIGLAETTARTIADRAPRLLIISGATGTGKTKVLSLLLVWSYFHKTYEDDSDLSRNFLLITPNIIVLDRIRTDFDRLLSLRLSIPR